LRRIVVYYLESFPHVSRTDVHDLLLLSRGPGGPPRTRSSSAPSSHQLTRAHNQTT